MLIGIDCRKAADFGIGTYIRGLVHGLSRIEGAERYLLFAPANVKSLLPIGERFDLMPSDSPNYSVQELFALARQIKRARVDLFHAPHYVVPFTRCPFVVTIHDLIHLTTPRKNALEMMYARTMIGRATSRSNHILTVSEAMASEISQRYPEVGRKLTVIPNGVDEIFRPEESPLDDQVMQKYGLRKGSYLLHTGNDKPHKNLDRLVRAHQAVVESEVDLPLVLAGADPQRFRARKQIVSLGFVPREELPSLYRNAMALILVSTQEGFGLPVVEAIACGTPVIISNIPALREVAQDFGVVVEPRSEKSMIEEMKRFVRDEELRGELRARITKQTRRMTWDECAMRTREVYLQAIEASARQV